MDTSALALGPTKTTLGPPRSNSYTPDSVFDAPGATIDLCDDSPRAEVIVVVDPVSTGACLAYELAKRGYRLVKVWSDMCPDVVKAHTKKGTEVEYFAQVQVGAGGVAAAAAEIAALNVRILDVMVGCESGVLCADSLATALGAAGNGDEKSALRRNKFYQVEAVRAAGLDAPLQVLARNAGDVEAWLEGSSFPSPFKAVVKPVEGAGSDGVSICDSPDEVRASYAKLEGSSNVLGLLNSEVLLQEYLRGDEYVVDTVSADGVHKCVAIWKYDKRVANNSPVVYFGMRLLQIDAEPQLAGMVAYVQAVLDAIGIHVGAMHTEIKLEERGPVLVEVNARLHGGEGIWLPIAERCLGYTQVTAMADAYRNRAAFDALPATPRVLRAHGAWVTIRSASTGVISGLRTAKLDAIRALPSYRDEYVPLTVGARVVTTVDACTVHGCFNLAHEDAAQLEADYAAAQSLVDEGLFDVACEGA